jgi:hypothetical protein
MSAIAVNSERPSGVFTIQLEVKKLPRGTYDQQ